ncbi:hypothetical protein C8F04DRAFT_1199905 [Mycena alexandri]|uniref:Uncharacterized protein n=1 Tax=Mycena alexandri TaxID=1745969 RepID=A0AAD6S2N7_9AGAR|nr:hypothetical protein C8F04DRAFT_1199905 [Mycena alexandri]
MTPNGMLNAIICLRWWKDAIDSGDEEEEEEWDEAVHEVVWVIEAANSDPKFQCRRGPAWQAPKLPKLPKNGREIKSSSSARGAALCGINESDRSRALWEGSDYFALRPSAAFIIFLHCSDHMGRKNTEELSLALKEEWENIDQRFIDRLYDSLPNCV